MSRAICIALVLLYSYVGYARADAPLPPPLLHRVTSPNGQFAVVSDPTAGTRVIETASGKHLWSVPGWFRSVYVSNDGRHVATGYGGLNLIPLDAEDSLEMISFWGSGRKLRAVPLRTIVPDRSILKRTASHYAWGTITGINEGNQLVVTRIDGREFRFSMATGTLE